MAIEVVDSSIYINIAENPDFGLLRKDHKIYKLDFQLNVLDSLDLSSYNTSVTPPNRVIGTRVQEINNIGEDTLVALVIQWSDTTLPSGISRNVFTANLVYFTKDLNIFNSKAFGDFEKAFLGFRITRIKNHLLLTGALYENTKDTILNPFALKLNLDGTPIDTAIASQANDFPTHGNYTDYNYIESFGDKYVVATGDINQYGSCVAILDSNLDVIRTVTLYPPDHGIPNFIMGNQGPLKRINDSTIILMNTGFTYRSDPLEPWNTEYYHFTVVRCDTAFQNFEIDTLTFSGFNHIFYLGIINPRGIGEFLDFTNLDSVVFAVPGRIQGTGSLHNRDTNDVFLYSYNLNTGTLNWQKKLVRNSGIRWNTQAAYLGGGKSVFVINEYDWNTNPNLHQKVVILIMNEHGDVIGQREFTQSLTPIVLYPNPAIDRIRIKVPSELHPTSYQIISVDGKVVDGGTWESSELSVENLPVGKYFLKVFDGGHLVAMTGFVRN
ncbi:MAG: hypothetical protein SchgKO_23240 [Schleiferiaceae bacterium]